MSKTLRVYSHVRQLTLKRKAGYLKLEALPTVSVKKAANLLMEEMCSSPSETPKLSLHAYKVVFLFFLLSTTLDHLLRKSPLPLSKVSACI